MIRNFYSGWWWNSFWKVRQYKKISFIRYKFRDDVSQYDTDWIENYPARYHSYIYIGPWHMWWWSD